MRSGCIVLASACLALPEWALAAPAAPDRMTYREKGQEKEVSGVLVEEGPDSVKFKSAGRDLEIATKDLVSLSHGDAPPEYQQADEAELQGDYAAAADLYQRSVDAKAGPWIKHDARFHRADCLYRLGDFKGAAGVLEELLKDPSASRGRFRNQAVIRLGQSHLFQGAFDPARSALDGLATAPPNSWGEAARTLWLARILEAKKDYAGARKGCEDSALRAGANFPDLADMAKARGAVCLVALGKAEEAKSGLLPLLEPAAADKAGGAALHNAAGCAWLALAKAEKDKEKAKGAAFSALWEYLKVVVYGDAFPEEHAAAYAGAEQCFQLLGDPRAAQMKEERKRFYPRDAFILP